MKKKITLIIALLICAISVAQTPEKMSYQAVVRNADGNIVGDTNIGVKISVLKNASTGTVIYAETHAATTNVNGLVTIEIGTGSIVTGIFANIDWGSDTFFIKSETDITGGSNYTISGTSQLLSVPYALNAKKADNVKTYKIGDFAHGGIVFWVDETKQHGLVCAKQNQSNGIKWFAGTFGSTYARGNGLFAGKSNNTVIISTQVFIGDDGNDYAARICNQLEVIENNVSYGDWYLPSAFELKLISQSFATINNTATSNGGSALLNSFYWSSTEASGNNAKIVNVSNAQESSVFKSSLNPVRAIRSF
ncbi:MAG: hypothetical protein WAO74_01430 [Polaribacter sp.]|uniref:hypothetical protein n=1 Tax=Polaribacter sp. TaxID=1920175 RepID=UPI003BAFC5F7